MKFAHLPNDGAQWQYYTDLPTYLGSPGILVNLYESCAGNFRLFETYITALNAGDNWEAYRLNRF